MFDRIIIRARQPYSKAAGIADAPPADVTPPPIEDPQPDPTTSSPTDSAAVEPAAPSAIAPTETPEPESVTPAPATFRTQPGLMEPIGAQAPEVEPDSAEDTAPASTAQAADDLVGSSASGGDNVAPDEALLGPLGRVSYLR